MHYIALISHRWLGLATALVLAIVGPTGVVALFDHWRLVPVKKITGPLHESLALGPAGRWIVVVATGLSAVVLIGGLILWFKYRVWSIRTGKGWRRILWDSHSVLGLVGFLLMMILAVSGVGLFLTTPADGEIRRIMMLLHTANGFSIPIKFLYALASLAFLYQAISGVLMWWAPRSRRAKAGITNRQSAEPLR